MPKNIFSSYYRENLNKTYKKVIPKTATRLIVNNTRPKKGKYEYLVLDDIVGDIKDIQTFLSLCKTRLNKNGRIIISYYNHLWEPILKFASYIGLRKRLNYEQNWLSTQDIANLLKLSGFDVVTTQKRFLLPLPIPLVSIFVNKFLYTLPLLNSLCLTVYVVARKKPEKREEYTVSIIVPARNEEKNVSKIISSVPKFGKWQEIIFIEGHSTDNTWGEIQKEITKKRDKHIKLKAFRQIGEGKGDAVSLGFKKASGEIAIIYDADRTVRGKDLIKFYEVLASGMGDFVNGVRLIYPMEKEAMRMLNKIANKAFSILFTAILGQNFKDTLCGTKALFTKDYRKMLKDKDFVQKVDPFGDFRLIFGAISNNLKVIEVPVRYKRRDYGHSNIKRFLHGLMLLRMTFFAYKKFKIF